MEQPQTRVAYQTGILATASYRMLLPATANPVADGPGGKKHISRQHDGSAETPLHRVAADLPNGFHGAASAEAKGLQDGQDAIRSHAPPPPEVAGQKAEASEPQRGLLGVHPNAAAAQEPRLPGVGPLLPVWRSLAAAMAPVFHPVRRSCAG